MVRSIFAFAMMATGLVLGLPTSTSRPTSSSATTVSSTKSASSISSSASATGACARVSSSQSATLKATPSAAAVAVPAQLAYDCLMSVPVDIEGGLELIRGMKAYWQWQSTSAYLKNPPSGRVDPPVDLFQGLDNIAKDLKAGKYKSEYTFQTDITKLAGKAYDFHFIWTSDISNVFHFQRPEALVSLSTDGKQLPQVFLANDIATAKLNKSFTPSPVTTINGMDVGKSLSEITVLDSTYHDPDVRYNNLFYNPVTASTGGGAGAFLSSPYYPGPTTEFRFSNGTTKSVQNLASFSKDFDGVVSGEAFFAAFCDSDSSDDSSATTSTESSMPSSTSASSTIAAPAATGYPVPVIADESFIIAGYYINGTGYEDTAVLAINSFESEDPDGFSSVLEKFLSRCRTDGKKKLIIDVRANGGGDVILGYDTFKQLFPHIEPYGATRWRAHDAINIIGTEISANFSKYTDQNVPQDLDDLYTSEAIYNYKGALDVNGNDFGSWNALFGPASFHNDKYTHLLRTNFSDHTQTDGVIVSHYGNRTNVQDSPFTADNMVLFSDGSCGSTCSIFHELMRTQAHVRSVVIGGRPTTGPMQVLAGSRGAQVLHFEAIYATALSVSELGDAKQQAEWNKTAFGEIIGNSKPLDRCGKTDSGETMCAVNVKDNIRIGDKGQTPLEFQYEAADCRIFNTAAMIFDPTEAWKAAYQSKWGNMGCVPGSTGHPSSLSGGGNSSHP